MLQPNCFHCAEDALISDTCSSLEQNNTPTVSGLDGYLSQDRIMKNSVAKSAGPATSDGMQAGSAFVLVDLQFMQTLPNIQLSYLNHFYDQSSTIKAVALPPSNASQTPEQLEKSTCTGLSFRPSAPIQRPTALHMRLNLYTSRTPLQ